MLVLSAAHADSPDEFSPPMFGGVPLESVSPEAYSNRLQLTHAVEKIQSVGRARLESAILSNRVTVDDVLRGWSNFSFLLESSQIATGYLPL